MESERDCGNIFRLGANLIVSVSWIVPPKSVRFLQPVPSLPELKKVFHHLCNETWWLGSYSS